MAKGLTFDNDLLKMIFQAAAIANVCDNAASSPLTNLYVSLHTADPTSAGNQLSSECNYNGYGRVAVPRSSGGWSVTANAVIPAGAISFPAGTGGSGTASNFAIGTLASGAGKILYTGSVSPFIVTGNGITPILTTASTVTET